MDAICIHIYILIYTYKHTKTVINHVTCHFETWRLQFKVGMQTCSNIHSYILICAYTDSSECPCSNQSCQQNETTIQMNAIYIYIYIHIVCFTSSAAMYIYTYLYIHIYTVEIAKTTTYYVPPRNGG